MKKKKVLFFTRVEAVGGHEVMGFEIIRAMQAKREYMVTVVVSSENSRLIEMLNSIDDLNIITVPGKNSRYQALLNFIPNGLDRQLEKILKKVKPDYVIALQGNIEIAAEIIRPARRLGIKVISYIPLAYRLSTVSKHPKIGIFKDYIDDIMFSSVDYFITLNSKMKKLICERGKNENNVYCVMNGIDFSKFHDIEPEIIRKKYNLPEKKHIYSLIGRIEFSQKGQDVLIKVLTRYREDFQDTIVLFVGGGDDTVRLHEMIKQNNLSDICRIIDTVKDPSEIYSVTDTVIIPSVYEGFEGTPLVMYEAMWFGCNVIGNAIPGMVEQLGTGYTFCNKNLESVKKCMLSMNKHVYQQLNRHELNKCFSIDLFINNFLTTLRKIEKS